MPQPICSYPKWKIVAAGVLSWAIVSFGLCAVLLLIPINPLITMSIGAFACAAFYAWRALELLRGQVEVTDEGAIVRMPFRKELTLGLEDLRQLRVHKPGLLWLGLAPFAKDARVALLVYRRDESTHAVLTFKVTGVDAMEAFVKPFRNKVIIVEKL